MVEGALTWVMQGLPRVATHTQVISAGAQLHGRCTVRVMAGGAAQAAIDQGQVAGYPCRNDINNMFTTTGSFGMAVDAK